MKQDWPGLELITDDKTTPTERKEELLVKNAKQDVEYLRNGIT